MFPKLWNSAWVRSVSYKPSNRHLHGQAGLETASRSCFQGDSLLLGSAARKLGLMFPVFQLVLARRWGEEDCPAGVARTGGQICSTGIGSMLRDTQCSFK